MKRMIKLAQLLSAALLIAAVPALADEGNMQEQRQGMEKNECLLVAMNCGSQVDTIQQRIVRIQNEMARGSAVYSQDELRRLNDQLRDANRMMENLIDGA